jgi:hypothetical protein
MRTIVRGVGRCWLLAGLWAAAGCGSNAADGSGIGPEATAPDAAAKDPSAPGSTQQSPTQTKTDPMGIGQMSMPRTADIPADDLDNTRFAEPGDTTFETAKPDVESSGNPNGWGESVATDGAAAPPSGNAGAAPGAPTLAPGMTPSVPAAGVPGQPAGAPAPASAQREIIEADIVQAHGDTLYVLNRYRGLVLIDMTQPDQPAVIGRVPFQAQPVDMYVRDGKAYIVMSDYFVYWQFDSDADPLGFHGSQLLVVDVQDPRAPKEVSSFKVQGEVTDTRIVGDVLYAVSKRNPEYWRYDTQDWKDTTWVLSISIANPSNIEKVDEKEFPGAANIIQVYQSAISIAAVDPNYYLVDELNARQTLVTFIDISDAAGKINVGGKTYVPGAVADKFKMDLSEGVLRVVSNDWYWQPQSAATLTLYDVSDPANLAQLSQVPLNLDVPNAAQPAQVAATRFTGNAFFESLCWWEPSFSTQSCRLDVYDLSDPTAPVRATTLPIDGAVTHFEARDTRLLSLGQHYISGQPQQVQVALFDIADLGATRRIATADLGEATGSAALSDYKAFKVLDELGMILLPLSWYDNWNSSFGKYYQGAQIIDWMNDALTVRGRIAQQGFVERAIAFKDRVVSISTEQVQVIDASNRDQPQQTGNLFLVRNVTDAFSIGGFEVQIGADEEDSSYRFYVLPFGEDDMQKSVAELEIGTSIFYTLRDGDIIHLIGYDPQTGEQIIRNADFSNPMMPRFRGEYRIPAEIQHIYNGGCGYRGYCSFYDYFWNPAAGQPLNNQLLPVTVREVNAESDGRRFYKNYLRLIDLRNADEPKLAQGSIEMPEWPFVNRVGHGTMLYSTHTEPALDQNGNAKQYHERYFLDRVDVSNPDAISALPKVNIPGRLVDVDASGKILYTVDYQWDEHGRRRNSFNVLSLEGDTATLKEVLPVGDEIGRARYMDREVWLSSAGYPWWGRQDDSLDSRQPYTRLTRLRFDEQAELSSMDTHAVQGYHFNLLDVDGSRVYLSTSAPYGLLILDTSDFANPNVLGASRTVGYVSKLVRDADYLYLPMGSYGVRRVQAP